MSETVIAYHYILYREIKLFLWPNNKLLLDFTLPRVPILPTILLERGKACLVGTIG